MRKNYVTKISLLLCLILPFQALPATTGSIVSAENNEGTTDFFSSFEQRDPLPKCENTVDLDNKGN